MMKWLRLMYCREFDTAEVLELWDTIFLSSEVSSEPNILEWLELLAIVMVSTEVRPELCLSSCTNLTPPLHV